MSFLLEALRRAPLELPLNQPGILATALISAERCQKKNVAKVVHVHTTTTPRLIIRLDFQAGLSEPPHHLS